MHLEPADIVFFRGKSWLSRTIRKMSRGRGEAVTMANHVGVIVVAGSEQTAVIVEALHKVRMWALAVRKNQDDDIAIARPINLSDEHKRAIAATAMSCEGQRYGYLKLPLHALDYWAGNIRGRDVYLFRKLGGIDRFPICSYLSDKSFKTPFPTDYPNGLDFGVKTRQAQPDDQWDFVISHPYKYKLMRDFKPL